MTTPNIGDAILEEAKGLTGRWWLYLISAIAWFFLAFLILSWDLATVWGIAVFAAIVLISGGLAELAVATIVPSWRWVHALFGIVSIFAGLIAIAWPGQTFLVLAAILAWYLLITGFFDIILSFQTRHLDELWWLHLVIGVAQILIGFWALGYEGRAAVLLVIWVAAIAIARGLSSLFIAFGLHSAGRRLGEIRQART